MKMALFDDPGKALKQMARELQDMEQTQEDAAEIMDEQQVYYEEDYLSDRKQSESGKGKSFLIAIVEVLVIAALIGGWLLWHK